jgi:integrase
LSGWHPVDLAAEVLRSLVDRVGLDPVLIDDVIMGCVSQVREQSTNIGRNAVLAAGWPETVPGTTKPGGRCEPPSRRRRGAALSDPLPGNALARAAAFDPEASKYRRKDELQRDEYRLVVLFLADTGVRFGEMAARRVGRLDLERRRATIAESVMLVGAEQVWGTPKNHERRDVPIPRFLMEQLAAHVVDKAPEDLVFTGVRGGGALRAPVFRRAAFDRAATAIGMPGLHPHELRHTAASLAIAAGADVKSRTEDARPQVGDHDAGPVRAPLR